MTDVRHDRKRLITITVARLRYELPVLPFVGLGGGAETRRGRARFDRFWEFGKF